jgi:putative ABC transport system permease protein
MRIVTRYGARAAARRMMRLDLPVQPMPAGDSLMRTLGLETRHALRALIKRPALSLIVVGTLSLGLGANAAILAMIDALVVRPFVFSDIDRIALVSQTSRESPGDRRGRVAPANFIDWKKQTDVFERLAAFEWWEVDLIGRDVPERVQGFFVSADFFPTLGVRPEHGRSFLPEEEMVGRHRAVVLGYGLWQRRFGGDPAIVGQKIVLDGQPYEVVGIAPAGFDFPMGSQVWAPLAFTPEVAELRTSHYLTAIARVAPGRTLEDAQAQMAVVAERLEREYPEANRGRGVRVYTLAQGMMDEGLGPILSLWQASALFVLLIACANIANLLLARGAERQREMAVRLAIGASRARVVREQLIETALLAAAAVPGALAVAWVSLRAIRSYMPAKTARFVAGWDRLDVDARLVLVTALVAVLTAVLCGMLPALQGSRPALAETLKEGGRSATAGRGRQRLRRALVVAEITLALPLLVASGMGVVGALRFINGPQGFDPDQVQSMKFVLPESRYPDARAHRQMVVSVVDRLHGMPGVRSAAAVNIMPSQGDNSSRPIEIDGRPNPDPANPPTVDFRSVTEGAFDTLGIPLLQGRGFSAADHETAQPVAIVSESMARKYWPDGNPLGRRLKVGKTDWVTVVGVCGDVIQDWFNRRNYPTLYRPFLQAPTSYAVLLTRSTGDPATVASAARNAVREVDAALPVFDILTMREAIRERTLGLQYVAAIMTVFGGLALVLAVVGVYGVMAFLVAQRTHEIGVRMALGATPRDVLRLAIGQTGRLTSLGIGLGVTLSIALGRLVEAAVLGTASSDVRLVAGFAIVLVLSALAAGYLPARRAAATDPMIALRAE